jgi:DNA transposition AAA+ family ATPase
VETLEHRRFTEFCEACRRYAYIGLCCGPPGVGKTLSARSYSRWDKVKQSDRWGSGTTEAPLRDTVFYTPSVVNAPNTIQADIRHCRQTLRDLAKRPLRQEKEGELDAIRRRDDEHQAKILCEYDWFSAPIPEPQPTYGQVAREYSEKELEIIDPTTLILIDEADRLRLASLEQVRAIFDAGEIGVILIGMPGLEKKLARYPQFYSRIGFVHEFRPLAAKEVRELFDRRWAPPGVCLPQQPLDAETVAAIIRITGGNFRLLNRLLTQIERILEINALQAVTKEAVERLGRAWSLGKLSAAPPASASRYLYHCEIIHGCEARKGNPPRPQRERIDETNR